MDFSLKKAFPHKKTYIGLAGAGLLFVIWIITLDWYFFTYRTLEQFKLNQTMWLEDFEQNRSFYEGIKNCRIKNEQILTDKCRNLEDNNYVEIFTTASWNSCWMDWQKIVSIEKRVVVYEFLKENSKLPDWLSIHGYLYIIDEWARKSFLKTLPRWVPVKNSRDGIVLRLDDNWIMCTFKPSIRWGE